MVKVLLVVAMFAVATYLLVLLIERRGIARPVRRTHPPRQKRRTVAPDDDEEFLRGLDQRRRHPEDPDPS